LELVSLGGVDHSRPHPLRSVHLDRIGVFERFLW
jgi:hypothetical protein